MLYNELTTVQDVRATFLDIVGTSDDPLMRDLIRSVSADIAKLAHREFVPRIETRYFDARGCGRTLILDEDLLAVTTLTNGDGNAIASDQYVLGVRNQTPYWSITLVRSSSKVWIDDLDTEEAISVLGTWGHDVNGGSGWVAVDTLGAAMTDTTGTSATLTSGAVKAGQLLKIDTEILYVGTAATTALSQLVRGANGSTAATHLDEATVYAWVLDPSLEQLAKEGAAARYRLRANPLAETVIALDGSALQTPKDIDKYLARRLSDLGLVRL